MEKLLTSCLSTICQALRDEPELEKKMRLVDDVTEFLLTTPDAFSSCDLSWTGSLYSATSDLLSNRLPAKDRRKVFRLISSLILGFQCFHWFLPPDGQWSASDAKYFNLLTRYTCVEIVMLLDDGHVIDDDYMGVLLIILEHGLMSLVQSDDLSSHLTPDQLSSLIVSIRSVADKMLEFADLHKDETEHSVLLCSIMRLLSLWIIEDNGGVSAKAGNVFTRFVVSVLSKPAPHPSHDSLHAAFNSITVLPDKCKLVMKEIESEMNHLLTTCGQNPDPESECRSVLLSFQTYMAESSPE